MATIQIAGHEGSPFPQDCNVRIEAICDKRQFPRKELVFAGVVSDSVTLNLNPGKYIVTAIKHDAETGGYHYQNVFLHECDEALWLKLVNMKPQLSKARHTSDGVRYHCSFYGCSTRTTSRMAAIAHEAGHLGINLMEKPELASAAVEKGRELAQQAAREKESARTGKPLSIPNTVPRVI